MAPIVPKQNTGKPWSAEDIKDLISAIKDDFTVEAAAEFLCRTGSEQEVASKCAELGLPVRWNDRSRNN